MKYRIVRVSKEGNWQYGVQKRFLGIWRDEMSEFMDTSFLKTFNSVEEAREYIYKMQKPPRLREVIEEIEI